MTQEQIEKAITDLQAAVKSLDAKFDNYATLTAMYSVKNTSTANNSKITKLQTELDEIKSSIALVNKISKLIDTNIINPAVGDTLRYDGDRWTNYQLQHTVGGTTGGATSLVELTDVRIGDDLTAGQALCYDAVTGKWTNITIESGGDTPSTGGLTVEQMWSELATESDYTINPIHVKGDLEVSSLTTTNGLSVTNGDTQLDVTTEGVTVNGTFVSTKEITAYGI